MLYYPNMPEIDLHGMDREIAIILVKEFLYDNYKMKNYSLAIIHGIGSGILKKEVHMLLAKEKIVEQFKLDNFNSGCTLVKLKEPI